MKKIISLLLVTMCVLGTMVVACGNKQQAQEAEDVQGIQGVQEAENNTAMLDAKAIENIQVFYKMYVFGHEEATDAVIDRYCTKNLAKKLADDYEYDGGGYAVWDFRSGYQDGDSDVEEVTKVEALGEGRYKVSYNDMGHMGSCIISVVVDGDNILFDTIR